MVRTLSLTDVEFLAHTLARELMEWNEPIPPFRTRYPEKLESCLNTVTQTFARKELYPSLIEKAAALFYLLVKNHPFQNGNKRVAVTTLLVFLQINGKWLSIDTKRLYNFAVWVAESDPALSTETIAATATFIKKHIVDSD